MKTVLFVHVQNSGRSQMADNVNPIVVGAMKEVGMDISKIKPRMLR
ncbi:hypothetical protein ACFLUG_01830 [Chloroflexota bacterium]